jgi:hypothetical protein
MFRWGSATALYSPSWFAFRFNQRGVIMSPAYIAQASANDFYKRRIGSLTRGRTTANDVEALFDHGRSVAKRPDGFIYYYALPVYNPFEKPRWRTALNWDALVGWFMADI